jgi:hypothetical protein
MHPQAAKISSRGPSSLLEEETTKKVEQPLSRDEEEAQEAEDRRDRLVSG